MMLSHSTAVAMPSGPTEPVTRSQDQIRRLGGAGGPASSETPESGTIPAVLLSVTVVQYSVSVCGVRRVHSVVRDERVPPVAHTARVTWWPCRRSPRPNGVRGEQVLVHGLPATEIRDRPQLLRSREILGEIGGHLRIDGRKPAEAQAF